MTPTHRLTTASGSKGFTALTVMALMDHVCARGGDLSLVDDAVTIDHLLGHRSGIGDYLDDDADPGEYLMSARRQFHDLVQECVLDRARLRETDYPRSDDLPPDAAWPVAARLERAGGVMD